MKRELKDHCVYKLQWGKGKLKEWRYLGATKIIPANKYVTEKGEIKEILGRIMYLGELVCDKKPFNIPEYELWRLGEEVVPLFLR